jgi:hypothetical protein
MHKRARTMINKREERDRHPRGRNKSPVVHCGSSSPVSPGFSKPAGVCPMVLALSTTEAISSLLLRHTT